ncbi:Na+/H+ antiporter subunit E [Micromonospora radicis]|uniref:Sodium:proton antiporter n=1 Tax=Micromonospora radicis TaxID=1894971 RepID=A0A418MZ37_9ACTN|nr:Na+/H+ antiporter subunit E [Micromonospora radicis]RIV40246.1 sodium:proton antiporter [Micromonospora radicis]
MTRLLTLPIRLTLFTCWFAGQVLRSSWAVLADILTPGMAGTPRVVRMPLESRTDLHTALIGVLITLTPGTLTLGVVAHDQDGQALLVHSMYHRDAESALADLHDMERRMLLAVSLGDTP